MHEHGIGCCRTGSFVVYADLAGDFVTFKQSDSSFSCNILDLDFGDFRERKVHVVGTFYRHGCLDCHRAVDVLDSCNICRLSRYCGGAVFLDKNVVEADVVVAVVGGVETDAAFVFVRSEQNSCTLGVVVVATNYFAVVVGQSVCLRLNGGVFAGCCFDVGDEVVLSRETGYVERKTVYLLLSRLIDGVMSQSSAAVRGVS